MGGGHANMMKKWILRFIPFWTAEGMYFQKKNKKLKKITNWQPTICFSLKLGVFWSFLKIENKIKNRNILFRVMVFSVMPRWATSFSQNIKMTPK